LLIALALLYFELRHIQSRDLIAAFKGVSSRGVAAAFFLVTAGYFAWSFYDFVSLRQIGARIPYKFIFRTTAAAFPVTNLVGYSLLTGFAIRARNYSRRGLSFAQITQVIIFNIETWWVGFLFLCGLALSISRAAGEPFDLEAGRARALGIAMLFGIGIYVWGCYMLDGGHWRIERFKIHLPDWRSGLLKVTAGGFDNMITTVTFYVLLPAGAELDVFTFATYYLCAQLLAVVSFVPGGLGVLEGSLLILLRPYMADAEILASLILFRTAHYLIPAALAGAFLLPYGTRAAANAHTPMQKIRTVSSKT
jgi:phosphatidylglycerol lysyltransferase